MRKQYHNIMPENRDVSGFYNQQYRPPLQQVLEQGGYGWLYILLIAIIVPIIVATVVWFFWYRKAGVTFGGFVIIALKGIMNIILWPIKFVLQVLGLWSPDNDAPEPVINLPTPSIPNGGLLGALLDPANTTRTQVVKHEISECPPCTNECNCPTCEETDVRPYELEIRYLKNMAKMVGSIARRENAINSQYKELYPGFSVMSPHVRKISHEYEYIKEQIREDPEQWQYFKNYFSRITGIPNTNQAVQYDLVV